MDDTLLRLLANLFVQSLLAIGGIYVIIAELQRVIVVENGWLTAEEFTSLFALAQAAPGPNTLFVSLLGWRISGLGGGILATLVFVAPSLILSAIIARGWTRWSDARWFSLLRNGFVPLTVGLLASSALLLTLSVGVNGGAYVVTAAAVALSLLTRLPPVAILGLAGLAGVFGLV